MSETTAPTTPDLFSRALAEQVMQEVTSAQEITVTSFKIALARSREHLSDGFANGMPAPGLVRCRSDLVDRLLLRAWQHFAGDADAALIAVGGYGRQELLPHSDIDLLVLYQEHGLAAIGERLEAFLTFLWDIGLQVGHSVRSPAECAEQAADDVTVITNMLEARYLAGSAELLEQMRARIAPDAIWPVADFFQAKLKEQNARHARYDETAYKLEPNTKESPGGLRDIQTIAWVAKRHFGNATLRGLVQEDFLTEREFHDLNDGQAFLWRVRFALHMISGRCEDRLLFDYQVKVAELFGYADRSNNLAVEQFMQRYYRHIKALSALNDTLLQLFSEAILHAGEDATPTPINRRFQARHGFIELRHDDVFRQTPSALLEIFYLMQSRPKLTGIRAQTLRLMRRDRHLIDDEFRADVRCRRLFMEILRQRNGTTRALRRMNRYGILGRYLPNFGQIIGRMQYDLFHTLTVDMHTLFVIRNLRRLRLSRFDHELPFASEIMQALDKPEMLYVAGLFHDIAKGRGGDHSELGAEDAAHFCREHGISSDDSELICWLVRQHLLMSVTAQRKDINDPAVVQEFARAVGTRYRLDRLFVFTVCDIRGTNPGLWNNWKESLLIELYQHTARALERGLQNPLKEGDLILETRSAAAALLTRRKVGTPHFQAVWRRFQPDYFLRHSAEEIAWHTQAIVRHQTDAGSTDLVLVEAVGEQGVTVFIYARDRDYLFGLTTGILAQLGLSILDARINTSLDGYTVDSYVVTESDSSPVSGAQRRQEIQSALSAAIASPEVSEVRVTRRSSRRSRHFSVPTQVSFGQDLERNRSIMELITADMPGLLSMVGRVFRKHGILVDTAKIGTLGERAEDVFYITDRDHQRITERALLDKIEHVLTRIFDRMQKQDKL